jgi:hypothetical protein
MCKDIKKIGLIKTIRECNITNNSTTLNEFGYILNTDISNVHTLVFINDNIKHIIVFLRGAYCIRSLIPYVKEKRIYEAFQTRAINKVLTEICELIDTQENDINMLIDKYSTHTITFFGHSLGGLIINGKLKNTKYKCYTYNPFLVTETPSENIQNYRTNLDIPSLLLLKENNTIHINIFDFMFKKNFDIIDIIKDSHEHDIIDSYPDCDIYIPIYI